MASSKISRVSKGRDKFDNKMVMMKKMKDIGQRKKKKDGDGSVVSDVGVDEGSRVSSLGVSP